MRSLCHVVWLHGPIALSKYERRVSAAFRNGKCLLFGAGNPDQFGDALALSVAVGIETGAITANHD